MSDIFREVDEEVRHDEYRRLWDRFGLYVIAVGLAIVLGVGGYKGWQAWQRQQAQSAGGEYMKALQLDGENKGDASVDILEGLAEGGPEGYAVLARFTQAGVHADAGRADRAVQIYDAIAADAEAPGVMRDLARVRAALLLVDTADRREIERRVSTLDQADNPWRSSVRELRALAAYKAGDVAAANGFYEQIMADTNVPNNLRQRAQVMLQLIAPMLSADGKGKPAANAN